MLTRITLIQKMMKPTYLSRIQQEDLFSDLCKLTTNILGVDNNIFEERSRFKKHTLIRKVVSVVALMVDNIHKDVIAKGVGRNRTSINYYQNMHKYDYRSYPEYRDLFKLITKT